MPVSSVFLSPSSKSSQTSSETDPILIGNPENYKLPIWLFSCGDPPPSLVQHFPSNHSAPKINIYQLKLLKFRVISFCKKILKHATLHTLSKF